MSAGLQTVNFADGRRFVPTHLGLEHPAPPFMGCGDNDEGNLRLKSELGSLWSQAFEAKRPEIERLKRCSMYYDGDHYLDPNVNAQRPVRNYPFSVVETIVPYITEARPRPEIAPRGHMVGDRAERLQEFATFLMDNAAFDQWVVMGQRDKSIYGYNFTLISNDYRTGFPVPRNFSVFDTYVDPTVNLFEDAESVILGVPISTRKLRAMYPQFADRIVADNIASPGYDVTVRSAWGKLGTGPSYAGPSIIGPTLSYMAKQEGGPNVPTTYAQATGETREHGYTTFLLQFLIRDSRLCKRTYVGTWHQPDPEGGPMIDVPGKHEMSAPVCASGWRLITMTHGGLILANEPVDPAFDGIPLVMGRRYPRTDKLWTPGDIDNIISPTRSINRRLWLLERALELSANPPAITDAGSGLSLDHSTIEAGELLRVSRGSDVKWMQFSGPGEFQFLALQSDEGAIDNTSGAHDVQQGQRPPGIQAAAAIRALKESAGTRTRAMEVPAHHERAAVLKKMMIFAGKKMNRKIFFKATNGSLMSITPEELSDEYDIQFAPGTGTVAGKQDLEEKAFALYDRGAIDEQELLEVTNWRNRDEVLARVQKMKMIQMQVEAEANARNAGNGAPQGGAKQ